MVHSITLPMVMFTSHTGVLLQVSALPLLIILAASLP